MRYFVEGVSEGKRRDTTLSANMTECPEEAPRRHSGEGGAWCNSGARHIAGMAMGTVQIVPIGPQHAANMLAWMGDPQVRANVGVRSEPSEARTLAWIEKAEHAFAIEDDGRHVGNVILDNLDTYLGTARLSIYLGERRGTGIGRQALDLICRYGFGVLGLAKIWLTVHVRNYPAIALYERFGFVREGLHRGEFLLDGERIDAAYMGLLRDEFSAAASPPAGP